MISTVPFMRPCRGAPLVLSAIRWVRPLARASHRLPSSGPPGQDDKATPDRKRVPKGHLEISPAFQRRDRGKWLPSPEGMAEVIAVSMRRFQPSVRDGDHSVIEPGVETPGYSRRSLRDRPWSLDILGRRFPSPGGRFENSPAVHCRVPMQYPTSPEETAESSECHASVHRPILVGEIQPSLRDSMSLFDNPTLERVGYSQISLRETPDEQPLLFEERRAKKCPNSSAGPFGTEHRPRMTHGTPTRWLLCPRVAR